MALDAVEISVRDPLQCHALIFSAGGPSVKGTRQQLSGLSKMPKTLLLVLLLGAGYALAQEGVKEQGYSHCSSQKFNYGRHNKLHDSHLQKPKRTLMS